MAKRVSVVGRMRASRLVCQGPHAAAAPEHAGGTAKPPRDQPTGQSGPRAAAHADDAAKPARDQPTEDSQPAEDSSLNQLMTTARDGLRDKDLVVALRARSVACCALTTPMIFW